MQTLSVWKGLKFVVWERVKVKFTFIPNKVLTLILRAKAAQGIKPIKGVSPSLVARIYLWTHQQQHRLHPGKKITNIGY